LVGGEEAAAGVGGIVAPYVGAAAAVPNGGRDLPSWPTALGCSGPYSPQRRTTVGCQIC
jgi:hypothetical protein